MRIVQIIGGLGNQMWQYAFLVALRKHFPNEEVYYNTSFFNGYPLHNGFELDRIFEITAQQASKRDIRKVYHYFIGHYFYSRLYRHYFPVTKTEIREVEICACQKDVIDKVGNYYYDGYWADHRYYDECREEILKEFRFKKELDNRNGELLSRIAGKSACSIHVRRGDYLKDSDFTGICNEDYYARAISTVKQKRGQNVIFLIFSNDLLWCKENLVTQFGDSDVVYVDWNTGKDSYKDMQLMSKCDTNIIANSSFSWWGAYLNNSDDHLVIAPKKYKNKEMDFNIYLDDWLMV